MKMSSKEYEIMNVLWSNDGSMTAAEIVAALGDKMWKRRSFREFFLDWKEWILLNKMEGGLVGVPVPAIWKVRLNITPNRLMDPLESSVQRNLDSLMRKSAVIPSIYQLNENGCVPSYTFTISRADHMAIALTMDLGWDPVRLRASFMKQAREEERRQEQNTEKDE